MMLEKLRRKFIFTIMLMVTVTLVVMSGVILTINYSQNKNDIESAVQYAVSDTAFQRHDDAQAAAAAPPVDNQGQSTATDDSSSSADGAAQPDASAATSAKSEPGNGGKAAGNQGMVATSCYLVASDGAVDATLSNALELDSSTLGEAVAYALGQYDGESVEGTTGKIADLGLFYSIRSTPSGIKAAFASDSYLVNGVTSLAGVLALVCLCVWIAFFGISIFLARWVVRPTERAWKQQQQFVADASHELKTPLTVVMANNSILLSHEEETVASQRRWVESSQSEAHQMLSLVNDMLFLAKPENQSRQVIMEKVDFSDLVEGDVLQFESVCFEKEIKLEEHIEMGISIIGDKARLQRLVSTLMDNACKYADKGGCVKAVLEAKGSKVVLAVENDGALIPPEDIPHIFDRFYRVDKARVRAAGGFGLGLSIAKEVVDEHKGSISVSSGEDTGTVFTVVLPIA